MRPQGSLFAISQRLLHCGAARPRSATPSLAFWRGLPLLFLACFLLLGAPPSGAQTQDGVVTHWNAQTRSWDIGAKGLPRLANPLDYVWDDPDTFYFYNPAYASDPAYTYLPYPDEYVAEKFSGTRVSLTLRNAFDDFVWNRTEKNVQHINFGESGWENQLRDPAHTGKLRVLHNVIFDHGGGWLLEEGAADGDESLATLFFPPGWAWLDVPPAPEVYPILFCGAYDPSWEVFGAFSNYQDADGNPENGHQYSYRPGMHIAEQVALSPAWGAGGPRPGAIGVQWNGGGGWVMSESAYRQFARLIDTVATSFGGKRDEIVIFGSSRGGLTALEMACRPGPFLTYEPEYHVVAACATHFVGRPGSVAAVQSPTYPFPQNVICAATGFRNSWKDNWHYPVDPTRPRISG
ncbi:MAG: hypothetical protein AB1673_17580, partial [Actinomycetota bacterium]